MKYATTEKIGGRRASAGRSVVVMLAGRLGAGVVDMVTGDADREVVWITVLADGGNTDALHFYETGSAADVEAMPEGSWTWPPRV